MKSYTISTSCEQDNKDYELALMVIEDAANKKREKLSADIRVREGLRQEYFPQLAELSGELLKNGKLQMSFFKSQLMLKLAPPAADWNKFSTLVDDFIRCNKNEAGALFITDRGKDGGISLNPEYL